MFKKCVVCGAEFEPAHGKQIVCSPPCKAARKRESRKLWAIQNHEYNKKYHREYYRKTHGLNGPVKVPKSSWLKQFEKADKLSQTMMIVKANDMTYPDAQLMIATRPEAWEKLVNETKARLNNAERE